MTRRGTPGHIDGHAALGRIARHQRTREKAGLAERHMETVELAHDSYRKGIVSFIDVLDAERQLSSAQQNAQQGELQVCTDLVSLYKALGGSWSDKGPLASGPSGPFRHRALPKRFRGRAAAMLTLPLEHRERGVRARVIGKDLAVVRQKMLGRDRIV